jgi:hypothetical protein
MAMAKLRTYPTLYDDANKIYLCNLRKGKYLESNKYCILSWRSGNIETSSILLYTNVCSANPYIELSYCIEKERINYRVPLVCVPSNLGKGVVWYFLCPYTQKRCRVLYLVGKYFLHREAFPKGMYECQSRSKNWRASKKVFDVIFGADEFVKAITRKHFRGSYNGRSTKRFLKLKEKQEQYLNLTKEDIRRMFQ